MIKVIAFDLDDTLWPLYPVIKHAEEKLDNWLKAAVPGLAYDVQSMRSFRDQVIARDASLAHRLTELRRQVIECAMLSSDLPQKQAHHLSHTAMEVFLAARCEVEFFEGTLEMIAGIATSYQLGALTNGNADIHRLGLGHHFSFAFSAETVGAPKPAPDLFHAALEHTGARPSEMVYVGDDPIKDIDSANTLGLHTIWLKNRQRPGPGATTPDRTIDAITELPDAIRSLDSQYSSSQP